MNLPSSAGRSSLVIYKYGYVHPIEITYQKQLPRALPSGRAEAPRPGRHRQRTAENRAAGRPPRLLRGCRASGGADSACWREEFSTAGDVAPARHLACCTRAASAGCTGGDSAPPTVAATCARGYGAAREQQPAAAAVRRTQRWLAGTDRGRGAARRWRCANVLCALNRIQRQLRPSSLLSSPLRPLRYYSSPLLRSSSPCLLCARTATTQRTEPHAFPWHFTAFPWHFTACPWHLLSVLVLSTAFPCPFLGFPLPSILDLPPPGRAQVRSSSQRHAARAVATAPASCCCSCSGWVQRHVADAGTPRAGVERRIVMGGGLADTGTPQAQPCASVERRAVTGWWRRRRLVVACSCASVRVCMSVFLVCATAIPMHTPLPSVGGSNMGEAGGAAVPPTACGGLHQPDWQCRLASRLVSQRREGEGAPG